MENIFLKHTEKELMAPSNEQTCQDKICFLKSEVRKIMGVKEDLCVLINAVNIGNCVKTIVMIECRQSEKMKTYSIDKHPSDIKEEDILVLEYRHYRPSIHSISLVTAQAKI